MAKVSRPLCIELAPVIDARTDPQWVGVVRNGFYMPTAHASTSADVAKWVGQSLQQSLTTAGARVCQLGSESLTLRCEVREAFVDEYWNLEGRVTVAFRLERNGMPLLQEVFEGRYSQASIAGSEQEFAEALRKALGHLVRTALPGLLAAAEAPAPPAL